MTEGKFAGGNISIRWPVTLNPETRAETQAHRLITTNEDATIIPSGGPDLPINTICKRLENVGHVVQNIDSLAKKKKPKKPLRVHQVMWKRKLLPFELLGAPCGQRHQR